MYSETGSMYTVHMTDFMVMRIVSVIMYAGRRLLRI